MVVHGFTGAPWDVLPVAERLASAGLRTHVPLLRGHERGARGIAAARLDDWRGDVDRALDAVRREVGPAPVFLAGLSMGGLLALDAALRLDEEGAAVPAALATMAVPLDLGRAARLLSEGSRRLEWEGVAWPKLGGPDIEAAVELPGANQLPLRSVAELIALMDSVVASLGRVRAPTLVLHALSDHTAAVESAYELAARLGARRLRVVLLREGFHVLPRDTSGARVAEEIATFFESCLALPRGRG